jgi:hypothetical protein
MLQRDGVKFDQGVPDVLGHLRRQNGSRIAGQWHRLLPCLEQNLHLFPSGTVDKRVGAHEGAEQIRSEIGRVRRANMANQ